MSFSFKLLGNAANTTHEVDAVHSAARTSAYPQTVGARGTYAASFTTGIIAAGLGANSEIFQFRFVHASYFALLRSVRISAAVSTTGFAAGVPPTIEMKIARAWTAQGTLGTGITWGTNDGKKRTDFATTVLGSGDVRIATTVALGAGTKTLDGTAAASVVGNTAGGGGAAPATQIISPGTVLWARDTSDEWPFLFENQEGFVLRSVQIPPTGTWTATVQVEWAEVDPAVILGWT